MTTLNRRRTFAATFLAVLFGSAVATAQPKAKPTAASPAPSAAPSAPATPPPASGDAKKEDEARAHFEKGIDLLDRQAWDAALSEFMASRDLKPTKGNTLNAALCLRNLNRFDEAYDMFEALLKNFPNLDPAQRQLVNKEITELNGLIGTIEIKVTEPGASVTIDGRERGKTPIDTPIRVAAGSHSVRIFKSGSVPIETKLQVAGGTNQVVSQQLEKLAQSGTLTITEESGRPAQVVIDNVVVGPAPYQDAVAPGDHVVLLRGEGDQGTQPTTATVRINQITPITLALETLDTDLRVEPKPLSAAVAVDGVTVSHGLWQGKLHAGPHKIEVADPEDGFLLATRQVILQSGQSESIAVELERDPNSAKFKLSHPPKIVFEVDGSAIFAPLIDGDIGKSCTGSCSKNLALGGGVTVHAGYQLSSGIAFGVDVGYMALSQTISGRATELTPMGLHAANGVTTDQLGLHGLTAGLSASLHRGETWPLLVRIGAGVLLGSATDSRSGLFTYTNDGTQRDPMTQSFVINDVPVTPSQAATYVYVAPEARFGRRFFGHLELSVGIEAKIFVAVSQPKWLEALPTNSAVQVPTGSSESSLGSGSFPTQTIFGGTLIAVSPSLGLRYDF